jgi:hypothetical protein
MPGNIKMSATFSISKSFENGKPAQQTGTTNPGKKSTQSFYASCPAQ